MMYMNYKVTVSRKAAKSLAKIDQPMHDKIGRTIEGLGATPRPDGCVKLSGAKDGYRVRVNDYRIVYTIDDAVRVVDIEDIGTRQGIYNRK